MAEESGPTLIQSVRRALTLLDLVGSAPRPLPAKALARRSGLALPTTYHLLRTLTFENYLLRLPDGGYVLGQRAEEMGRSTNVVTERTYDVLRNLHSEMHAAAYLSVFDGGRIQALAIVDSPTAPRIEATSSFDESPHATAVGKSFLATLDTERRERYLAGRELGELTKQTITSRKRLAGEISAIKSHKFAVDDSEYAEGTGCIAIPVPLGSRRGSVAVSVPSTRLHSLMQDLEPLRRAARSVAWTSAMTCGA